MTAIQSPAEFTLTRKHVSDRRSPVAWLVSHTTRYWWLVVILFIGAIGNAALAAIVPILTGNAFNTMLQPSPDTSVLLPLALLMGGSQIVRGILQLGRNFGAELIAQRVERDVRDELYVSLLGKSMTFHNLQPVGDTMARATNDVREVNYLFSPGVNLVVGSLVFLVMPIVFAPRFHWSLVLTPILFTIAYFITLRWYLRTLNPITEDVRDSFGKMNTHLSEALDGIETLKGAAQEEAEIKRFNVNSRRLRNNNVRQGDVEASFVPLLLFFVTLAVGLFHSLLLYRQGILNVGDIIAYFGILTMLEFPTWTSIWAYSLISSGLAGARRILELMNRENNLDQNAAGHTKPMTGRIEFRNVSFAYPATDRKKTDERGNLLPLDTLASGPDEVLENITFTVQPGQTVAIVGQTGSGKTSLAKLVNRIYDATQGQVLVDGVDVRDWNLASLRSQISIIEQDVFLFSRPIKDNIAFGKPGATLEEIEAAARSAQADEFINTFEKGYETVIGERGVTLSGGQRQRLAIARAFLTDPRILILVLRNGRIAAIGSHEELMKSSEAYSRIFRE